MKYRELILVAVSLSIGVSSFAGVSPSLDQIELDDDAPPTILKPTPKPITKQAPKKLSQNKKTSNKKSSKDASVDDIELDETVSSPVQMPKALVTNPQVPALTPDAPLTSEIKKDLAQAELAEKAKDSAGVVKALKPHLEKIPRKGLLQLARAYRALDDNVNEAAALEIVVAKNPSDYVTQTMLGEAYLKLKRFDVAGKAFLAARTLNNKYRPAYEGQWKVFEKDDSKYEARTLVLDMNKTFGPDPKITAAICRMYSGEDFLEKTVEGCRLAIATDNKNPDNYFHLAMALRDESEKDEAQKLIDDAAKRFPKSEKVQTLAGEMKAEAKDFASAYTYFKQATLADAKSVKANVGLGNAAFELRKHTEAIAAFEVACRIDKRSGRDFRAAALLARKNKDPQWMAYQSGLEACE